MNIMRCCCYENCQSSITHECAGCGLFFCIWHSQRCIARDIRGFPRLVCNVGCQNSLELIECMDNLRWREAEGRRIRRWACLQCHGTFLMYVCYDGILSEMDYCTDCKVAGKRLWRGKTLRTYVFP